MQSKRDGLIPIREALADLPGPVQALRETPPSARRYFTRADQVNPRFSIQIVGVISLCLTVVAAWHCSLENSVRSAAIDCANWNSNEYFEAATAADVTDCLQSGADPKARHKDGVTPLHWAAGLNESPAIITALLDAGADLKARDKDGLTPLHCCGHIERESRRYHRAPGRRSGPQGADKVGVDALHWAWDNESPAHYRRS